MTQSQLTRFTTHLSFIAVSITLLVIILGAYTRLTDAGLGCPDWPGCYGHIIVPQTQLSIEQANILFPHSPLIEAKAWAEMLHRYAVFILLCLMTALIFLSLKQKHINNSMFVIPLHLIGVVLLQVLLGMWTVTLQLWPVAVTGHLLLGLITLALLWWLYLSSKDNFHVISLSSFKKFRFWAALGLTIVLLQIALGGWTSSNYASLACPHFPFCIDNSFPLGEFHKAFNVFMPIGANFQGGKLDLLARMTIHTFHRLGALITSLYLLSLFVGIFLYSQEKLLHKIALSILIILLFQVSLGILNVVWLLPLGIAVAHTAVAALLLLTVITLNYALYAKPTT